ncbi:MAG: Uma2 family endonuclease [Bryobacteraceae bacterium]|nr:Uma2 family endonuclease [Bryobacteraceae bacterium]
MNTAVLIPLADYLSQIYHPDCDDLEGRLEKRNAGEISHSDAQGRAYLYVQTQCPGFWAGVEVRVQVKPERFRVPDVAILRGGRPAGRTITEPPEVVVEVLSPDDPAADVQNRIDDFLNFGVPCVWVIRPETQRAWVHTREGSYEARDRVLRNSAGYLAVPLAAIFS